MKKQILYIIPLFITVLITGCNNKSYDGKITIECTGKKEKIGAIETQNIFTYHFDDNKYVTDYSVTTNQKFSNKSVYNEYKKAQEETVENSLKDVTYELKTDDKKKSLIFTMTVKNIDINSVQNEEEKNSLKASSILKSNEKQKNNCKLYGISKKDLK